MEDEGHGKYANYFKVRMNPFETVVDFGEYFVEDAAPTIHTRIVTTPPFARVLSDLLTDSLRELEERHGPIPNPGGKPPK